MSDINNKIDDKSYICQFIRIWDYLDELNDDKDNKVRPNINKRKKKNNNKTVQ